MRLIKAPQRHRPDRHSAFIYLTHGSAGLSLRACPSSYGVLRVQFLKQNVDISSLSSFLTPNWVLDCVHSVQIQFILLLVQEET